MRITLALVLLGFIAPLFFIQGANAQSGTTWASKTIPTGGETVTSINTAQRGDEILVVWKGATNGKIGVSYLSSPTAAWVKQTSDVGITGTPTVHDVVALSGSSWMLVAFSSGTGTTNTWKTTDNGATWTAGGRLNSMEGSNIGVRLNGQTMALGNGYMQRSTDGGATWLTGVDLLDNHGASTGTGTRPQGGSVNSGEIYVNGAWLYSLSRIGIISAPSMYYMATGDGGDFWSTIYTAEGGSTLQPPNVSAGTCPGATTNTGGGIGFAGGFAHFWRLDSSNSNRVSACVGGVSVPSSITQSWKGHGGSAEYTRGTFRNNGNQYALAIVDAAGEAHVFKATKTGSTLGTFTDIHATSGAGIDLSSVPYSWEMGTTTSHLVYVNSVTGGQLTDDYSTIYDATTATPTASVTGITQNGFDVDPTGTTIISRQGGGTTIKTYAATGSGSLAVGGTTTSTCTRVDAIGALRAYVTYADCQSDPNIVSTLRIRSATLGDPPIPAGSDCSKNPTVSGFVTVPPQMRELGRLDSAAWDFTNHAEGTADYAVCTLSWTYSTTTGYAGVYSVSIRENCSGVCTDADSTAQELLDPSGQVSQICSWSNTAAAGTLQDPKRFLAASSGNGPNKVWTVGTTVAAPFNGAPTSQQTGWFTPSSSFSGSTAVGCGGYRVLLGAQTKLGVVLTGPTVGQTLWTRTLTTGSIPNRGATLSGDGRFGAFTDGTTIHIFNGTTGADTGTLVPPTCGVLVNMKMDLHAQGLWLACNDGIYYWAVQSAGLTTATPESNVDPCAGVITGDCTPTTTTTNTGASTLTFLGSAISTPSGFTASTFGLFLGVILIAALAAGFYFIHQSATMAGGGALAGVFLSFSFGLIGLWVILVLAILAAGVIFMRFRSGA